MGTSQSVAQTTTPTVSSGGADTAQSTSPDQRRSSRMQSQLGNSGVQEQMRQVAPPDIDPPHAQTPGTSAGPLQTARARQILDDAFGNYREISAGDVRLLAQADFQTAYDAVYGSSQYSWAQYVVPRFGNLNGFANNGINYINQAMADETTVPHEMLHNNIAGDWRGVVGSPFDEGSTEYLEQYALHHAGINSNLSHYPNERAVVDSFLAAGRSEDQLFTAYLSGGADSLVEGWVNDNCTGTWAQVKQAMDQSQWATARAHLVPKPGGASTGVTAPTGGTPATGAMSIHVQIKNNGVSDGWGTPEFFAEMQSGSENRQSPVGDIADNAIRTFRFDLAAVPIQNITVKVWEDDSFLTGGDDLLAQVDWAPPFAQVTTSGNDVEVIVRKEGS